MRLRLLNLAFVLAFAAFATLICLDDVSAVLVPPLSLEGQGGASTELTYAISAIVTPVTTPVEEAVPGTELSPDSPDESFPARIFGSLWGYLVPLLGLLLVLVVLYFLRPGTSSKSKTQTTPLARASSAAPLPPSPPAAPEQAFLELQSDPPKRYLLAAKEITLGRASDNDLVIPPDVSGVETVSAQHARLVHDAADAWIIEDLKSTNGLYINGSRTGRNLLREGWEIGIGGVRFVFHAPREES